MFGLFVTLQIVFVRKYFVANWTHFGGRQQFARHFWICVVCTALMASCRWISQLKLKRLETMGIEVEQKSGWIEHVKFFRITRKSHVQSIFFLQIGTLWDSMKHTAANNVVLPLSVLVWSLHNRLLDLRLQSYTSYMTIDQSFTNYAKFDIRSICTLQFRRILCLAVQRTGTRSIMNFIFTQWKIQFLNSTNVNKQTFACWTNVKYCRFGRLKR